MADACDISLPPDDTPTSDQMKQERKKSTENDMMEPRVTRQQFNNSPRTNSPRTNSPHTNSPRTRQALGGSKMLSRKNDRDIVRFEIMPRRKSLVHYSDSETDSPGSHTNSPLGVKLNRRCFVTLEKLSDDVGCENVKTFQRTMSSDDSVPVSQGHDVAVVSLACSTSERSNVITDTAEVGYENVKTIQRTMSSDDNVPLLQGQYVGVITPSCSPTKTSKVMANRSSTCDASMSNPSKTSPVATRRSSERLRKHLGVDSTSDSARIAVASSADSPRSVTSSMDLTGVVSQSQTRRRTRNRESFLELAREMPENNSESSCDSGTSSSGSSDRSSSSPSQSSSSSAQEPSSSTEAGRSVTDDPHPPLSIYSGTLTRTTSQLVHTSTSCSPQSADGSIRDSSQEPANFSVYRTVSKTVSGSSDKPSEPSYQLHDDHVKNSSVDTTVYSRNISSEMPHQDRTATEAESVIQDKSDELLNTDLSTSVSVENLSVDSAQMSVVSNTEGDLNRTTTEIQAQSCEYQSTPHRVADPAIKSTAPTQVSEATDLSRGSRDEGTAISMAESAGRSLCEVRSNDVDEPSSVDNNQALESKTRSSIPHNMQHSLDSTSITLSSMENNAKVSDGVSVPSSCVDNKDKGELVKLIDGSSDEVSRADESTNVLTTVCGDTGYLDDNHIANTDQNVVMPDTGRHQDYDGITKSPHHSSSKPDAMFSLDGHKRKKKEKSTDCDLR